MVFSRNDGFPKNGVTRRIQILSYTLIKNILEAHLVYVSI